MNDKGANPAMARVTDTTTTRTLRDGAELHCRSWQPESPVGGVYVFHGLGEHIGRYDALARFLAQRGWWVAGHDHCGHGRSSGARGCLPADDTLVRDGIDQLRAFTVQLGRPPVLLGHSMGGALAAQVALSGQVPLGALVLSSPALDAGLSSVQKFLVSVMSRLAPDLALPNGLKVEAISHDPAVVQAYRDDPLVHGKVSARLVRWLDRAGSTSVASASRLALRTALLVAGADELVDPSGSRRFAQAAPAGLLTLHWYDSLYHEIFNERADLREPVWADLAAFLQTLRQAA